MNRIDKKFQELKKSGKVAFIPYVTAGDPALDISTEIIVTLAENGADILEIGIPFSDPLADGPIIQAAVSRALDAGMTVKKVLSLVREIRKKSEIPIVLFTYLNPILKYGLKKFASDVRSSGADGVLVLDLPPEESAGYKEIMDAAGLKTIYLVAPTSTDDRIRKIARYSTGFIYCVSRTGVTGLARSSFEELERLVKRIRKYSTLPLAVGFGVSDRSQVQEIGRIADAVVVGSAIVKVIGAQRCNPVPAVKKIIQGLI